MAPQALVTTPSAETEGMEEPNTILFLSNLPDETTERMLSMLFSQFEGFEEVRLIEGRHDIAFVEYTTIACATEAKGALNDFKITPDYPMKIAFAKK